MAPPPSDRRSDGGNTRSLLRLLSDERLARRAAKGDRDAFETIWRRHRENVYRFCLAMTGSPDEAREALRRIEARALRALPATDGRIEPKPWLYRIARGETGAARRHSDGSAERPVADTAEARVRVHRLLDDLGRLPRRQRAVLVMRELSGLGYAEIGAAFDTSGEAARRLACEARRALDEIAGDRDEPAAIAPLPLAGLLGLVTGASEGSGLAGALGLGAGTAAGTSAAAKLTATAALVAIAVGVPTVGKSIRADPPQRGQEGIRASIGATGGVTKGDADRASREAVVARANIPAKTNGVTIAHPGVELGESAAKPEQEPALAANAELSPGAQHSPHPVATPVAAVQPVSPAGDLGAGTEVQPGGEEAEVSAVGESPSKDEHPADPAEDAPVEQPAGGTTSANPDPPPPDFSWPHWSGHHKKHWKKKGPHKGGKHGHGRPGDSDDNDEADEPQAIVP